MNHSTVALLSLIFLFFTACDTPSEQEPLVADTLVHKIAREAQRKEGKVLPGLQHGFEQSPINIHSSSTAQGHHQITLYYKDEVYKIENKGHTVQLDFQEGSTIVVDDTVFNFKQCHFHTPSEHLIDGQTFAMEMHIVNMMANGTPDSIPQYLVIGVLFKEGKDNKFIAEFLKSIPNEAHTEKEIAVGTVSLHDLFYVVPDSLRGHYYQYRGSLTTPPYTESVRWYIARYIFEASAEQIAAIRKVEGDNARHVKALYGRKVSE